MFRQIVSKTHRATPSGVAGLWNLSSLLGFEKVGDVEGTCALFRWCHPSGRCVRPHPASVLLSHTTTVYAIDPRTVLRPAEFQVRYFTVCAWA